MGLSSIPITVVTPLGPRRANRHPHGAEVEGLNGAASKEAASAEPLAALKDAAQARRRAASGGAETAGSGSPRRTGRCSNAAARAHLRSRRAAEVGLRPSIHSL